jgi:hypothetical protein
MQENRAVRISVRPVIRSTPPPPPTPLPIVAVSGCRVRLQQIAAALDAPVTFFYDSSDGKTKEAESLLFLDSAFSLRLLRAYSKIKDQAVQRRMVSLREVIADSEDE